MEKICIQAQSEKAISPQQVHEIFDRYIHTLPPRLKNILLLPPDGTRRHSGAGWLTNILFHKLETRAGVSLIPATGTHRPMTPQELKDMFGDVPQDRFIAHRWREDTVPLGVVPEDFIDRISAGALSDSVRVTLNRHLLSDEFDLIISIGQVVPHEVVGMANYSKNVLVGVGGEEMINMSHFMGAIHGLERLMGRDHSPVRKLYDYAESAFLPRLPIHYVLTVNDSYVNPDTGFSDLMGLYIGRDRSVFESAVSLSQQRNITRLAHPVNRFLVYLDKEEFRSLWVGCKAVYRTRLAVADGGEIVIIAPGLERFGEDPLFDQLIRKYGYVGTDRILKYVREDPLLAANLAVAAHLIHGSPEGRFKVTFAADAIPKKDLEGVNYNHMTLREAQVRYDYQSLTDGWHHTANGEDLYCISNPAAGLWVAEESFRV